MYTKKKIGILFCCLLLLCFFAGAVVLPKILNSQLQKLIIKSCDSCVLQVSNISISPFVGKILFRGILLTQGNPKFTAIKIEIPVLSIQYSILDLLSRKLSLNLIEIESPMILVTEGDGIYPDEDSVPTDSRWTISGDLLTISNGIFTYVREYSKKQPASIHIAKIQGNIGAWSTEKKDAVTLAKIEGELEGTGAFLLKIQTPFLATKNKLNIDLKIENLNLHSLNSYFKLSEGIELSGLLLKGVSSVLIEGELLHAWVRAQYQNLDIDFKKTKQRTAWITFLSNLAESLKIPEANLREKAKDQTRGVSLNRKPGESMVSFILRGMKDSALKVATGT